MEIYLCSVSVMDGLDREFDRMITSEPFDYRHIFIAGNAPSQGNLVEQNADMGLAYFGFGDCQCHGLTGVSLTNTPQLVPYNLPSHGPTMIH
nr:hypothetical protein CFP56_68593 [Quercus suber]